MSDSTADSLPMISPITSETASLIMVVYPSSSLGLGGETRITIGPGRAADKICEQVTWRSSSLSLFNAERAASLSPASSARKRPTPCSNARFASWTRATPYFPGKKKNYFAAIYLVYTCTYVQFPSFMFFRKHHQ